MNAIERLHAIRDGQCAPPPLYDTLGITVLSAIPGTVTLTLAPCEQLANPHGQVGGGILATALDTAAAWACDTVCQPGRICTTIEFKTNFIKPVWPGDEALEICASVLRGGSRVMVAEARMTSAGGDLVAIAIVTCLVIEHPARTHPGGNV